MAGKIKDTVEISKTLLDQILEALQGFENTDGWGQNNEIIEAGRKLLDG